MQFIRLCKLQLQLQMEKVKRPTVNQIQTQSNPRQNIAS